MNITSNRVVEALAQIDRLTEAKPQAGRVVPLSIAISRQAGSGGAEIAQLVGAKLNWPVYDSELLRRIAEEKGLNEKLVKRLDERCVGWIEELIAGFSPEPAVSEGHYMKYLLSVVSALGKVGHCVIVGRGAGNILSPETTLRIRVVASRLHRVFSAQKGRNLTLAEAERWVDQTDGKRGKFVSAHFHVDPNDPLQYDLIVNSGRLAKEKCADLIVQAAQAMENASR